MISVVIPVYNEAHTIAGVVTEVSKVPFPKEIIVVNDGSTDETLAILNSLTGLEGLRVVSLPRNQGKGTALRHAFELARGEVIVVQDADLEQSPDELPGLCAPILSGEVEVVIGSRWGNGRKGDIISYLGNRSLTALANLLFNSRLTDIECASKAFRRSLMASMDLRAEGFEIEPELVANFLTLRVPIREMRVAYSPRTVSAGKKIRWRDGVSAALTLLRCRFLR